MAATAGARTESALYEVSPKYASGIEAVAVAVNGKAVEGALAGDGGTDYYSVSSVGMDSAISVMLESLSELDGDDDGVAPFVRGRRHPSSNDTECGAESELSRYHSACTMKYTASSGGRWRVIYLDADLYGGTFYVAVTAQNATRYRLVCASLVSELELGVAATGIAVESAWKYYIFQMTEQSTVPLVVDFTLLSGSTPTRWWTA